MTGVCRQSTCVLGSTHIVMTDVCRQSTCVLGSTHIVMTDVCRQSTCVLGSTQSGVFGGGGEPSTSLYLGLS